MKRSFIILMMTLFATSSLSLFAQENDQATGVRVNALQEKYFQVLDFQPNGFEADYSVTYHVLNHKSIYIDIHKLEKRAVMYFNYHPVFEFDVKMTEDDSDPLIVLLDGKGDNGLSVNRDAECMSVMHNDGSIHEVSGVMIQRIPGSKLRVVPGDLADFKFTLHNQQGTFRADFYIKDFLAFSFDAGLVLKASGDDSTCDVWDLIGNSDSVLSFNPESKVLYFREGSPTGTWALLKKEFILQ